MRKSLISPFVVKGFFGIVGAVGILGATVLVAFQISPWPSALIIRRAMDRGGIAVGRALEPHVPRGVASLRNEPYSPNDPDAYLDVFYPSTIEGSADNLPTIIWVHGGGWLAGSKDQIANYLMILASKGYVVVGVNYALSPENRYPKPVAQVNAALAYIQNHAARFHVDPAKLFLAGDSSGAQIAAQVALVISASAYARDIGIAASIDRSQLRGVVLYCGLYDGPRLQFRWTLRTALYSTLRSQLWAYFGVKQFLSDPRLVQFSPARHLTPEFPPMFISVGNLDWLEPQSHLFAESAAQLGIQVDSLFFAADYNPRVMHQYQFNLDSDAGWVALERSLRFLREQAK